MNEDYNENFARAGLPLPPEETMNANLLRLSLPRTCHKGPQLEDYCDSLYFAARHRGNPQAWRAYYAAREQYLDHMRTCQNCANEVAA